MTLQEDCTGYEFVLGEIHGLRWWKVDRYGRLHARTYSGIWSTGEQVAECKRHERSHSILGGFSGLTYTFDVNVMGGTTTTVPPLPAAVVAERKVEHVVPADDCGCGFYAFTDPTYDYSGDKGDVCGVIRGYGRTLIGAHGFRSAKAEVVALHVPGVRTFPFWRSLVAFNIFACLLNVLSAVTRHTLTGHLLSGGVALINVIALAALVLRRPKPNPVAERLRLNYPTVPQYRSVRAMLKAHPLTPTVAPSPDTDPDFWTRP